MVWFSLVGFDILWLVLVWFGWFSFCSDWLSIVWFGLGEFGVLIWIVFCMLWLNEFDLVNFFLIEFGLVW